MVPRVASEDDVPDTNNGTQQTAQAGTAVADGSKELLADLAEALQNYGNPQPEAGHSKEAQAVEEKAPEKPAPAAEDKTPPAAEAKAAEKPVPHLDALPDSIKTTFEKLHKGEALTPEEVEAVLAEVPKGYLRQSDYTKKRMKDAEDRRAFEADRAKQAERLAALDAILSDPKKNRAFLKALESDTEDAAPEIDITKDPKEVVDDVRKVVRGELSAEKQAAEASAKREVEAESALKSAVTEWYDAVKDEVTKEEGEALLVEIQAGWAERVKKDPSFNPLTSVTPDLLVNDLTNRATILVAKRKIADLEKQLAKRQSDAARSAKASSSPTARVTPEQEYDLRTPAGRLAKAMRDEGIENWSQVRLGNRGPETAI